MHQPKTFNDVVLLLGCEVHANVSALAKWWGLIPAWLGYYFTPPEIIMWPIHVNVCVSDMKVVLSFFPFFC